MRSPALQNFLKFLADFSALGIAFVIAYLLAETITFYGYGHVYLAPGSDYARNHAIIFFCFALAVCGFLHGQGHYTQRLPWWHQVRQVVTVAFIAMLAQGFLHYAQRYPLSRMWVALAWATAIPMLLIARLAMRRLLRAIGAWTVPTIIIGGPSNALETAYALHSDSFADFNLRRIILLSDGIINKEDLPARYKNVSVYVGIKAAYNILSSPRRTYIVLAPDDALSPGVEQFVKELKRTNHNFGVVPPINSFSLYDNPPRYFFGHDVMIFHPTLKGRNPVQLFFKRLLDVTASSLGLLLLSPLFLVIALLIKKQSPGSPVFFRHRRVGQGGKTFKVYKFSSMVANSQQVLEKLLKSNPAAKAEWERDFKLKDDPRITPIGKILRATSLDELPQLWNVLKGHMSLVGPRPIVQEETKFYGENLHFYLKTKPGLTGLWQVSGRNDTTYAYRVYLDTWYAKHWSLWHDVVILLETVKIVIKRSGAY